MPELVRNPSLQSLLSFGAFGPQVTPRIDTYATATLAIGLGQFGWKSATCLHDMVNASFRDRARSACQFLVIAHEASLLARKALLADRHCLLLSPEKLNWLDIAGRYHGAGVTDWWPGIGYDVSRVPDYSAIRCYGRLMLFTDPRRVFHEVKKRTDELIKQSQYSDRNKQLLIFLLASVAEAESSSLILDVAYLLRQLLSDHHATVVAVLSADTSIVPEDASTLARANVYATLKEIDSAMINPSTYAIGLPVGASTARLSRIHDSPLLDYVLITGNETDETVPSPPGAVAEMAYTWMEIQAGQMAVPLEAMSKQMLSIGHFDGYTSFQISKIGLPIGKAAEMFGGKLAGVLLHDLLMPMASEEIEGWVAECVAGCAQLMDFQKILVRSEIKPRLEQLIRENTLDSLSQRIADLRKNPNFTLYQMISEGLERINREMESASPGKALQADIHTLRMEIDSAFEEARHGFEDWLLRLPTDLVCESGHSLQWVINALNSLMQQLNVALNRSRAEQTTAQQKWAEARDNAIQTAKKYDKQYSGLKHLLHGTPGKELTGAFETFNQALNAMLVNVQSECRTRMWRELVDAVGQGVEATRAIAQKVSGTNGAIARVNENAQAIQALLMKSATQPEFPAAALFSMDWYNAGTANVAPLIKSPFARTFPQVYKHWVRNTPNADHQLERFLVEIQAACADFVKKQTRFPDLDSVLSGLARTPHYYWLMDEFQKAAMPHWKPDHTDGESSLHEWLRGPRRQSGQGPSVPGDDRWHRREVESPEDNEMCRIRMIHHIKAENIKSLFAKYRRAFDQIAAQKIPLHLDRRWDNNMPDLISAAIQAEAANQWELTLMALRRDTLLDKRSLLLELIPALGNALTAKWERLPIKYSVPFDFVLTMFSLKGYRLRLPPNPCPVVFMYSDRPLNELCRDIVNGFAAMNVDTSYCVVVDLDYDHDNRHKIQAAFNEQQRHAIVLDEADFKAVVRAREPLEQLRTCVLEQLDLALISPFYTDGSVPDEMFFGRESEIGEILTKIERNSVALIGGRKIGKTSIMEKITRLVTDSESPYYNRYRVYYVDCEAVFSYEDFFDLLSEQTNIQPESPNPSAFTRMVNRLLKDAKIPLVFLFDEIDHLMKVDQEDHGEQMLRNFRALSNSRRCQFVFSGERRLLDAMRNANSVLFNFAAPVRLNFLDINTVRTLVTKPFEILHIYIESGKLIDKVYTYSAGHPNIVQEICKKMVEVVSRDMQTGGRMLTERHVEQAIRFPEMSNTLVRTFQGQMHPLAKLITLIWPAQEEVWTREEIVARLETFEGLTVSPGDMEYAVEDLKLYHFVELNAEHRYRLIPTRFPALVDLTHSREVLIERTLQEVLDILNGSNTVSRRSHHA